MKNGRKVTPNNHYLSLKTPVYIALKVIPCLHCHWKPLHQKHKRASLLILLIRRPSSFEQGMEPGPTVPVVSKATGLKKYLWSRCKYIFLHLLLLCIQLLHQPPLPALPIRLAKGVHTCAVPEKEPSFWPWDHNDPVRVVSIGTVQSRWLHARRHFCWCQGVVNNVINWIMPYSPPLGWCAWQIMVSKLTHLLATKCTGMRLANSSTHPKADSYPNCVIIDIHTLRNETEGALAMLLTGWNRLLRDWLWIPDHCN